MDRPEESEVMKWTTIPLSASTRDRLLTKSKKARGRYHRESYDTVIKRLLDHWDEVLNDANPK